MRKILYIALAITVFAVGVLLASNIKAQKAEIDSLRTRVQNLEILEIHRQKAQDKAIEPPALTTRI